MNVEVRLFAGLSHRIGRTTLVADLPEGSTVGDLRRWMIRQYPELDKLLTHTTFAVDVEYVPDDRPLSDGTAAACIPPVSGG